MTALQTEITGQKEAVFPGTVPVLPAKPPVIHYPDSDGKPMADNDLQYYAMTDIRFSLKERFSGPDVYVGGDLLIYYREGDISERFAPDAFVVFGVPRKRRRSFKTWEEGKLPDAVFEIASQNTWKEDLDKKHRLYERLGIPEYFLFDPSGLYFAPPLQGYRLERGVYIPIPELPEDRGDSGIFSLELNLELWQKESPDPDTRYELRFYDPVSRKWLPTWEEVNAARKKALEDKKLAETRAEKAETELARLRAELARLKSER